MNFSSLAILLLSLGCLLSIAPVQGSPCLNIDNAAEERDAEGDDAEEKAVGEAEGDDAEEEAKGEAEGDDAEKDAEGEAEGDASDGEEEEEGKGSPRGI